MSCGHIRRELYARCVCTLCGSDVLVLKSNLLSGKTRQCKKCNVKAGHETFAKKLWGGMLPDDLDRNLKDRWNNIKARCEDPTSRHYPRYGGRGIRLSDEFQDPRVFVAYVKALPNMSLSLELDRIDNNRGYERGNLRWVDNRTNVNNREISRHVVYNGKKMPLTDFVAHCTDLSYTYVTRLLKEGKTPDEIVNWQRQLKHVEYDGKVMTFRQFVLNYTDLTCPYAKKLYLRGKTLHEIANWQRRLEYVEYDGKRMPFRQFVERFTEMSPRYAYTLRSRGATLQDLVAWRPKNEKVDYHGESLDFPAFVKKYTRIPYSTARALYRQGKSLDEIASRERRNTGLRLDQCRA